MPSIGVTGTVGSGKSLVLEFLSQLGAETIQADKIGHELLEEEKTGRQVLELFGESVLGADGGLDRSRIAERVFGDPEAMHRYNSVVHPRLLKRLEEWLARSAGSVVAVEAALIPEWGIEDWFDEVWCIRCSDETALKRWKRDTESYWKIRGAQFAPERKQARAERVIENECSQEELRGRIWREWERFGGGGNR